MTDFKQIEETILSIMTVSLSSKIGFKNQNERFATYEHLQRLNSLIRGMPDTPESPKEDDTDYEGEEACYMPENICDLPDESYTSWISWAKYIRVFRKAD